MGLTTWKADVVRKSDVTIAKNYLHEDEIVELNRIVGHVSRLSPKIRRGAEDRS